MKNTEQGEFQDFLLDQAAKFGKAITVPEVDLWFQTFKRATLPDFKGAWVAHKRDPKQGGYFPTINQVQRLLRIGDDELIAKDWRCAEEVNGQRCGFPGSIKLQGYGSYYCGAHYRMKGTESYSDAASLQIIEESASYRPPKTSMELMERGSAQRAVEGERWRKARGVEPVKRRAEDAVSVSVKAPDEMAADAHIATADQARLDAVNDALAFAAQESA